MMDHWCLLSLAAMMLWGITGITLKLSARYVSAPFAFLGFVLAFFPVAALIVALFPVDLPGTSEVVVLGVTGGILNGLGALTSLAALRAGGKASLVAPITYLYPLVTVLAARLLLREILSARQWAGVLLAVVAAWLLSAETDRAEGDDRPVCFEGGEGD